MKHRENKMHMNLGSYIIIFFMLGVITAVSLFIFLPRYDYEKAFNNVALAQSVYDEENINRKNLDEYLTIISDLIQGTNQTNETRLNCYITLISILNDSNAICLNALIGVNAKSEYNNLIAGQNEKLQNYINYKAELANHITSSMSEIFRTPAPNPTIINEYVNPFLNKLQIFVQNFSNFYMSTASIIEHCSLRGIENNELVITANTGINLAIQRIMEKSNINNYYSDVNTLNYYASIMLDQHFYTNYYSQLYTVAGVNQTLNQIC